ncbi:four helix bundle protein [Myroides marinus]|uniref:four helix bundle protein n=1 Tax=Myroides marinus TaxID=703342 RepID=UPI00257847FE|nr:four helix bundle protein [Myroides marinus]MDM1501905.1 four helix bundle protein [Myroides marinus]
MLQEKPHQELQAWKEAMHLATSIYQVVNVNLEKGYLDLAEKIRSIAMEILLKIEVYVYDDLFLDAILNEAISKCKAQYTCLILGQRLGFLKDEDAENLMRQINVVESVIIKKIEEDKEEWKKYISRLIEGEEE